MDNRGAELTPSTRHWSRQRLTKLLTVAGLLLAAGLVVWDGWPEERPSACNDLHGNPYVEDVLVDRLPSGTLRSYINTGADCDDRRTGSVAAAWAQGVHPAGVVDQLTRSGWSRTDPADPPEWYTANAAALEPGCLSRYPGAWQQSGLAEYATPACSAPAATQIVLTKTQGSRFFVARLNAGGMTVDVAHTKDGRAADRILRQQEQEPLE